MILRVPARDLRPGDRCRGSGAVIVANRGPAPDGRVDLTVSYPAGKRKPARTRRVAWNRRTQIGVERSAP